MAFLYFTSVAAKWVMYAGLLAWAATFFLKDRLPPLTDIQPALLQQPVQRWLTSPVQRTITYKGQASSVTEIADYAIWGVVVTHNDPGVWYRFDISHDDKSLDTRDFCVIWGSNLQSDDYRRVTYYSDDSFCSWRWKQGVRPVSGTELSNNHLIADNEAIRRRIAQVSIGDQIFIKGRLANYSEARWGGWTRSSSTRRDDTGDGACEIVFVEDLQILASHNRHWVLLHRLALPAALGALLLRIVLFFVFSGRRRVRG